MIQLHPDYMILRDSTGKGIPCSAELVAVEVAGEAGVGLDPDFIKQAAIAVMHYFKNDLHREVISVAEFSGALEFVLKDMESGSDEKEPTTASMKSEHADLRNLATACGKGFELFFFARLRDEMSTCLERKPELIRFSGIRSCVKQLVGAQRWSNRCQKLHDQIVEFLRSCLPPGEPQKACALLIS